MPVNKSTRARGSNKGDVLCRTLDHYHEELHIFEIVTFFNASFIAHHSQLLIKIKIASWITKEQLLIRIIYCDVPGPPCLGPCLVGAVATGFTGDPAPLARDNIYVMFNLYRSRQL